MAAIETTGLEKEYGDVTALAGLDLEVREGEVFGFLGPNGAGKSTTIDVLLDFVRPTAGNARVLGLDSREESREIRRRTGVLPEGYDVYDRLSGKQHLDFVIESKGADDDPWEVLDDVGIGDAGMRKAGGYSTGMRQRLLLGMALVGEPDLLILDEPSTGLDPSGVREIRERIREVADGGGTVFFSSHILSQVEAVCDRVGILREGELVAVDTVEGLRDAAEIESTLTVTTRGGLDDDAVSQVRALEGVSDVTVYGNELVTTVADTSKFSVLSTLEAADVRIVDFQTEEASLEELFLSYTEDER